MNQQAVIRRNRTLYGEPEKGTLLTNKQVRLALGLSRMRIAGRAGVSDAVARVYEADRDSVSQKSRERLDPEYEELRSTLVARLYEKLQREMLQGKKS